MESSSPFVIEYSNRLPLFTQQAVDAVSARPVMQQQEAARHRHVFHKHNRVHSFREVAVEQEGRQQREERSEEGGKARQEAEQNRQPPPSSNKITSGRINAGTPIACMYCAVAS